MFEQPNNVCTQHHSLNTRHRLSLCSLDLCGPKVPVVAIAGSADRLLPSVDEVERLKNLIPGCRSMVLQDHGHAPLFDGRVDMSEIITGDPTLEGVEFPEGGGDEVRLFFWV